jgi:hypothetical protein
VRQSALLAVLCLAAWSDSGGGQASVYENIAIDAAPTKNADAVAAHGRDCRGASPEGCVTGHACGNELFVEEDGNNEPGIEGAPAMPELKVTGELGHRYDQADVDTGKAEHAKGAESFQKYLTGLFEDGHAWRAALGGVRDDLKNALAAAVSKVES